MQMVVAENATPGRAEAGGRIAAESAPARGTEPAGIGPARSRAAGPPRVVVPGIARVVDGSQPFTRASWASRSEPTVVELSNGTRIGGREIVVMAGLGPAETEDGVVAAAHRMRAAGATVLHAGTFRPLRSPYLPAGRGDERVRALARARRETGMAVVAEAVDFESARLLADHVDVLRMGRDNMQNYPLLSRVARLGRPVLLVRGQAATLTELLLAAEYVLDAGNGDAILCEAGVLGLSPDGRTLLDLTAVPVIRSLSHLPVVVAPGAAGAAAMACAAIAAGADGVVLEAASAGPAADGLAAVMERARSVAAAMGRRLAPPLAPGPARG